MKNVPGDYPTIQTAINAANIGDTIKVAAGTYGESVILKSGICLEGAGIDQTVISKSGASGILGSGVSYVIVKNLTVENSGDSNADGGGIDLTQSNNIALQFIRLTGNTATNGGGLLISGGSVLMDHVLIDSNTAHNVGGGMVVEAGASVSLGNVTVANNTWSNAFGNGGIGGIRSYGSTLHATNSIFWGNGSKNVAGDGLDISDSDVGNWAGGTGNVSNNPQFSSTVDYHLQTGSPAVGMGAY